MNSLKNTEQSVFAVVVTFDRPKILRICIDSLLTQIEFGLRRIHVIVNSKDEATKSLLKSYYKDPITYEFLDNPGPAGGFHVGLQRFTQGHESHVWLMDDDVVVRGDCLKEMLRCTVHGEYICPTVIAENGKVLGSYGWWGPLLSKKIVEQVGFPITELFYWAEDTEYLQHRIRRVNKIVPFQCRGAVVNHLHVRTEKRPSWYYYYVMRNTVFYRLYILKFSFHHLQRILYLFYTSIFRILFKEDNKIKKVLLMVVGLFHGASGKIGKLVDPALNK